MQDGCIKEGCKCFARGLLCVFCKCSCCRIEEETEAILARRVRLEVIAANRCKDRSSENVVETDVILFYETAAGGSDSDLSFDRDSNSADSSRSSGGSNPGAEMHDEHQFFDLSKSDSDQEE